MPASAQAGLAPTQPGARRRRCPCRAGTLPLVCRKLRALLATASRAFWEVDWGLTLRAPADAERCAAFLAWLLPRAAELHSLSVVVERAVLLELSGETVAALQVGRQGVPVLKHTGLQPTVAWVGKAGRATAQRGVVFSPLLAAPLAVLLPPRRPSWSRPASP